MIDNRESLEEKLDKVYNATSESELVDRRFRRIIFNPILNVSSENTNAKSISNIFTKHKAIYKEVSEWLVGATEKILGTSFNLYFEKGIEFEKTKVHFTENMIANLFQLMRNKSNNLKGDDLEFIDKSLGEKILEYSCKKYPLSEEKKVNSTLEKMVLKVNRW